MMNWRAIGTASALAIFATFSTVSSAQDIHGQQAALEKEVASLNQQIAAKQQQITALRNKPSPEQADVAAAQKTLDAARAELSAAPGPDSEGKVRNAEFKLKLAQLKLDKANGGIDTLKDDIDQLKQQISARQQQIKDLSAQSVEQSQAQQQKLAEERAKRQQQEQELTRAKREAEAAQKEIERLKAALAEKEAAKAKTATAATAAGAAADAALAPAKAVENTPAVTERAPKPAAAPQPEVAKASTPTTPGKGIIKLDNQAQVLHELQATAERAAEAERGDSEATLIMYMKHPGAKTTNKDRLTMRALGNNQYRVTADIEPGDYEAIIGFNRWPVHFSASESGEMTFLCDYRDKSAVRLVIYPKALEGGQ